MKSRCATSTSPTPLCARHLRQLLHDGPGDPGRRGQNPRWVPAISSATFASIGAHVGTQAAAEAARVIFRFGLWPAALDLWGIAPTDPRAKEWDDGELAGRTTGDAGAGAAGIAGDRGEGTCPQRGDRGHGARLFPLGLVAGDFYDCRATMDGRHRRPGVRSGGGEFFASIVPASNFRRPTTTDRHRLHVDVRHVGPRRDRARNRRVAHRKSVQRVRMRQALVPEIVLGQAQGGFAMGVGYALLETLPPYEDGPGNGKWNLGEYVIARGSDLPLHDLEIEVLPPVESEEPPKGMAEVVMVPVVPALLNAIYDATGHRFRSLPVTQVMMQGVLK